MRKLHAWLTRYLTNIINIAINLNLAGLCVAMAMFSVENEWTRYWLWFCAGMQIGFALMWVVNDITHAIAREKMKAEMHKVGAEYVQKLHEVMSSNPHVPLPPNFDQPPRMH